MGEANKYLRERREALGLSQQDAAMLIDVSRVTYIKWEQDTDTMPVGKYEKLMAEFDRLDSLKNN